MVGHRVKWILPAVALAWSLPAAAQPLTVVNVGAPAVNCVFDTSCTIGVSDFVDNIPVAGIVGTARLQSRMFTGSAGAPAAGFHGYMYRVNLTDAMGILDIPCVLSLRVTFGPVASFQYNGAGPLDQVFVVTAGGVGTIGLSSANKVGDDITFTFASPVCAGGSPGTGATSFFFGLASDRAPQAVTATVAQLGGGNHAVAARAPGRHKCTTGTPLSGASDACVASVCAIDSFCCTTAWDSLCVAEVRTVCDSLTCPEANGTCTHSLCTTGSALVNSCDSAKADCVADVCAADPFCCTTAWDNFCVLEVETVCGNNCD
jgi:hypothetical protein